jgi:FMN phosphatase YigB (HAD superfamily)
MTTQKNIEGLLFDLGGVVINIDFDQALQTWARYSRLPVEVLRSRFSMDSEYKRHERGEINEAEYFKHLRDLLQLEANNSEIATGWNAIFAGEISETVDNIQSVSSRLPCFAFTNSNPTHQVAWTSAYPRVVSSFHQVYVSSELGLRKPEHAAFDAIAEATGISLTAMLFFDDTLENVQGARAAGLEAVHVKAPSDVKHALLQIGAL